jgi:predicted amino acid racemase
VDSRRIAERLNGAARRLGRRLPILLEIKLSAEATKEGISPEGEELPALLERLPDLAQLDVQGLMTIAPFDDNPDTARACFRRLRELRDALARAHPNLDLRELSMGMSGDFAIAIEEGSTLVRIGTALFGPRPRPAHPRRRWKRRRAARRSRGPSRQPHGNCGRDRRRCGRRSEDRSPGAAGGRPRQRGAGAVPGEFVRRAACRHCNCER